MAWLLVGVATVFGLNCQIILRVPEFWRLTKMAPEKRMSTQNAGAFSGPNGKPRAPPGPRKLRMKEFRYVSEWNAPKMRGFPRRYPFSLRVKRVPSEEKRFGPTTNTVKEV